MPATASEKTMLRYEFGGNNTSMPDAWIDALFDAAESENSGFYTTTDRTVVVAAVNYKAVRQLYNQAAKAVTYSQNETEEDLSDVAKALFPMIKVYKQAYHDAIDEFRASGVAVGFMNTTRIPSRDKEYPSD